MRSPRISSLLLLTTISAVALGGYRLQCRAEWCRAVSTRYAQKEAYWRTVYVRKEARWRAAYEGYKKAVIKEFGAWPPPGDFCPMTQLDSAEREADLVQWYSGLKNKYAYAARHPWLAITADPPKRW